MKSAIDGRSRLSPTLRWLVWSVYTAAWTTALLTPQPVEVAVATMSPDCAHWSSKLLHVSAYALLMILSGWLRVQVPWRWCFLVFPSVHALATEFFQRYVPLRTGSWEDVGIDHIGIAIGLLFTWKWWSVAAQKD